MLQCSIYALYAAKTAVPLGNDVKFSLSGVPRARSRKPEISDHRVQGRLRPSAQALTSQGIEERVASGDKIRHRSDIARLRTDQSAGHLLLSRMRNPAGDTPGCEDIAERLLRETGGLQQQCGVELDIGLQ